MFVRGFAFGISDDLMFAYSAYAEFSNDCWLIMGCSVLPVLWCMNIYAAGVPAFTRRLHAWGNNDHHRSQYISLTILSESKKEVVCRTCIFNLFSKRIMWKPLFIVLLLSRVCYYSIQLTFLSIPNIILLLIFDNNNIGINVFYIIICRR